MQVVTTPMACGYRGYGVYVGMVGLNTMLHMYASYKAAIFAMKLRIIPTMFLVTVFGEVTKRLAERNSGAKRTDMLEVSYVGGGI